ncbi:hypothetical protein MNBD_ALPHA03-1279 [hydrothermal vent metagenome]|uniref:Uncharacterized protein n=1 Tax=hydrothermal vent metagenome TaxID=652676 RepID=A0A3B1APR0_9ZZZZ
MAAIQTPKFNYMNAGQAIAQGNQNALAQMQMQQMPEQLQMRRDQNQFRKDQNQNTLASGRMSAMLKGLDYMSKSARMVNDQSTYEKWGSDLVDKGLMKPGMLNPAYSPEYMSQVMGTVNNKIKESFGPMGPIPGSPGLVGQRENTSGKYSNITKVKASPKPGDIDPLAPWAKVSDPKEIDKAKIRFGSSADKQVEKMFKEAEQGQLMNSRLDRFVQLNETNRTGAEYNIPLVGAAIGGARGLGDSEFQEMESITSALTPQMRQGLPGAASERDVQMFRRATVSVGKNYEANKNISNGLKAANQNKIDRANFYAGYRDSRGHLRGAEKEWKEYLKANPIFDLEKDDYSLNGNRKTYEQWKEQKENPQQAEPQQNTPSGVTSFDPITGKFSDE